MVRLLLPVAVNKQLSQNHGYRIMNIKHVIGVGFLVALVAGCASSPEPLEITNIEEIEATVIAVDAGTRMIELRGPNGNAFGFRVGPEVRNLSQVVVGDILRVSYVKAFLVSIAEPGNAGSDLEIAMARAPKGSRPGGIVGVATRETVEIVSVAPGGTAVSFRDSEGLLQSVEVMSEEGQAFAKKLRQGDLVDMQYGEAIAVSVEASGQ